MIPPKDSTSSRSSSPSVFVPTSLASPTPSPSTLMSTVASTAAGTFSSISVPVAPPLSKPSSSSSSSSSSSTPSTISFSSSTDAGKGEFKGNVVSSNNFFEALQEDPFKNYKIAPEEIEKMAANLKEPLPFVNHLGNFVPIAGFQQNIEICKTILNRRLALFPDQRALTIINFVNSGAPLIYFDEIIAEMEGPAIRDKIIHLNLSGIQCLKSDKTKSKIQQAEGLREFVYKFNSIKDLNLSYNKTLENLSLDQLPSLLNLNIEWTSFKTLIIPPTYIPPLYELRCASNGGFVVPQGLVNLVQLNCQYTNVTVIPDDLRSLRLLCISDCRVRTTPPLPKLEFLIAARTPLTDLSKEKQPLLKKLNCTGWYKPSMDPITPFSEELSRQLICVEGREEDWRAFISKQTDRSIFQLSSDGKSMNYETESQLVAISAKMLGGMREILGQIISHKDH